MIYAVFKTMLLRLIRDPGALLLAIALPPLIYIVFASIFTTATSGDLSLQSSVYVEETSSSSQSLISALGEDDKLSLKTNPAWSVEDIEMRVRLGVDDVGLIIAGDMDAEGLGVLTLIEAPGRDVAGQVMAGKLASAINEVMNTSSQPSPSFNRRIVGERGELEDPSIAYYVGAVAIMFVMFSTLQSASIVLEERNAQITARILSGNRGGFAIMSGRFLFLVALGLLQIAAIGAVAQLAFDVPITPHMGSFILISLALAVFCAGFALLIASLCESPSQLHAVSTFTVLVLSAVGGAMVPRFMMPDWLQGISEATPVGWVIDLYYGLLARGQGLVEMWGLWGLTLATGAILTIAAAGLSQRLGRT